MTKRLSRPLKFRPIPNVGDRFGILSYIGKTDQKSASGSYFHEFQCDCGNRTAIQLGNVRDGSTASCGCRIGPRMSEWNKTHGMSHTVEYRTWSRMKERCYKEKCDAYPSYGGRGISVCDRWLTSFENFFADMGPKPSKEHSLDRIDNDGNYAPENCRWTTWDVQHSNKRNNYNLSYNGRTQCLSAWAREIRRSPSWIVNRLARGKSLDLIVAEAACA